MSDEAEPTQPKRRRRRSAKPPQEQSAQESPSQAKKTKRGGRGSSAKRRDRRDPFDPRLTQALRLLNELAQEQAERLGVPRLSPFMVDFELGGDREDLRAQRERVTRQLQERVLAQVPTQWRRGSVYCFYTDSAVEPPDQMSIFVGYDALGRPQWRPFLHLCLEAELPELQSLFADPPKAVALEGAEHLSEALIDEVRAGRVYDILAQLTIGPISPQFTPPRSDEERRILTIQVVLSQPQEQPLQVRVNFMGLSESELFDVAARSAPRSPIAQARTCLQQAQLKVRRLEAQARQGALLGPNLRRQARRQLAGVQSSLLRILNGAEGRTRHAQERHHQGERPTSHARRDAQSAGDERLLFDVHRETVVVIGPKSRAHVFSLSAEHITSLRLGVGEVERKLGQGRWRPLSSERASQFRARMKGDERGGW